MSPADEDHARRIEWTGERCVPWTDDIQVIYEHYQRYLFTRPLASGRRVLDLASGEGYGSALLAAEATSVLGVELDVDAVAHATDRYHAPNLAFRQGNMLDLSGLEDDSFDLVVCYEALEHVEDHEKLLAGIARVLAPDGIFVVSTPDRLAYNEGHDEGNPFHVHELTRDEFATLLGARFDHIAMWGQNVAVGSLLLSLDSKREDGEVTTLTRDGEHWSAGARPETTYYVAIASNAALPDLPAISALVDPELSLVREPMRRRADAEARVQRLEADRDVMATSADETLGHLRRAEYEIERRSAHEEVLRDRVKATRAEGRRIAGELERAAEWVAQLEAERSAALSELAQLRASASFRTAESIQDLATRVAPPGSRRRGRLALLKSRMRSALTGNQAPVLPALPSGERSDVAADEPVVGALPSLPTSDEPRVSIVIPVHGEWEATVRCLWSLAEDIPANTYEVIVVDDASPDITPRVLAAIGGISVVTLESNQGFIHAVNAGAARAVGDFVVLLNNDTEVQEGWLDALVAAAESSSDIGVVGARLTYPDGMLQEAGAIIFGDASGWNYGRGKDPGHPSFNFRRDVDYCSGACLLVRGDLWESIGGFDARFAPAYYEDADLAFAARDAGYRVIYEPRAVVAHHEGVSYGDDESPKKRDLMTANRKAFQEKWRAELAQRPKNDGKNVRTSSWRRPSGHALVVDHMTPTYDQDAGSQRMYELLRILNDLGYAVTFIPFNGGNVPRYTEALEALGVEVLHGPIDISDVIAQLAPDLRLAILSRPKVAWSIVPMLQELAPEAKIVYDTVDLHFVRERRRAAHEDDAEAARIAEHYRDMELWLGGSADATIVVSEIERELLIEEVPDATVFVVPTIHRHQHSGLSYAEREGLLFVGGYNHPPNRDAAEWLVEEILPIVHRSLPDVPTYIVGSNPPESVRALAGHGVEVLGWVEDLRPMYAKSRVFVAPLRYGAGVRGKIGESASYGLPIVSTTLGVEGLALAPERDVLVVDGAADFAAAIVRAYNDKSLWAGLAASARREVVKQCSPESVRVQLHAALVGLGLTRTP